MSAETSLLLALRNQARKDDTRERRAMVSVALSGSSWKLAALALLEKLGGKWQIVFAGLRAAGLAYHPVRAQTAVLSFERNANEGRAVERLQGLLADHSWQRIRWGAYGFQSMLFFVRTIFLRPKKSCQAFRVLARQRGPFFLKARGVELLFAYVALLDQLKRKPKKILLTSTEGSPHGLALMAAASRLGHPLVFAAHSPISNNPIRIRADLGIFYGEMGMRPYLEKGSSFGAHAFFPPPPPLPAASFRSAQDLRRICFCLSIAFDREAVADLIGQIRALAPALSIGIRPHPSLPEPAVRLAHLAPVVPHRSFAEDLPPGTLAIAGNSTVHWDLRARGVHTAFFPILDSGNPEPPSYLNEKEFPAFFSAAELWRSLARGDFSERPSPSTTGSDDPEIFPAQLREMIARLQPHSTAPRAL